MEKSVLQMLLEGNVGGIPMSEGMLLFAGISLEVPFLMILLSTVLPYKSNRRTNAAAAFLMIVYQLVSFFCGSEVTLHYIFFSIIEILGNAAILVLALKWKQEEKEGKYAL
jgi:FtsH-binding integral membrane protein